MHIHTYIYMFVWGGAHARVVRTGKDQRGMSTVLLYHSWSYDGGRQFAAILLSLATTKLGLQAHVLPEQVLGPEPGRSSCPHS